MPHRVSPQAEADLDDIWYYIATQSGTIEVADRLIDSLTHRFFLLVSHPYIGRVRDEDFGIGSRTFPSAITSYCIVSRAKTC